MKLVYLDSSAVVKRYIEEEGSEVTDTVYHRAEARKLRFAFSLWNIGEVIGALDRYASRDLLTKETFRTALTHFIAESIKMVRLQSLQILPLTANCLIQSWQTLLKNHIYEADALQISASKEAGCDLLLTADTRLTRAARKEGLEAVNIEKETEQALNKLVQNT